MGGNVWDLRRRDDIVKLIRDLGTRWAKCALSLGDELGRYARPSCVGCEMPLITCTPTTLRKGTHLPPQAPCRSARILPLDECVNVNVSALRPESIE